MDRLSSGSVSAGRPRLSRAELRLLVGDRYGVSGDVRPLPSDRDQNALVTSHSGERFVLKIASANQDRLHLEAQTAVLAHLHEAGLAVPELVTDRSGGILSSLPTGDGGEHLVRLVHFLPGTPLVDISPRSIQVLKDLGRFLATMDQALQTFDHPGCFIKLPWDVQHAEVTVGTRIHLLAEPTRADVRALLDQTEAQLAPVIEQLDKAVIHGDANDHNVLVGPPSTSERRVAGILDFGDMTYSYRLANLAVGIAYAILDTPDPVVAGRAIVRGYHSVWPLREADLGALHPLVCRRLAISLVMSAENRQHEPDDAYLSVSEKPFLDLLSHFSTIHPRFVTAVYRRVCEMEPSAHAERVRDWLERENDVFPVVFPDPASAPVHVFDFSPASDWDGRSISRPLEAGPEISARIAQAGAELGVGRYNEPRLVYTGAQFCDPRLSRSEARTIHLGIDIFQPEGSRVFAPLAGTVVSAVDNDQAQDYGPTVILKHEPEPGLVFYTLYGHLSRERLLKRTRGERLSAGDVIGTMGDPSENGGWVPHLHVQVITDLFDSTGNYPGVASAEHRDVWLGLCPDPNLILRIPESAFPAEGPDTSEILEKRSALLGPSLSISYRRPLHIVRGVGQYLYSETGRQFLDAVNNVPHVGHCHPHVVAAGQRQMAVLNTNTRYLHRNLVEYAERLAATMPDPLGVVFFVNSGSEANDLALRMAFKHTGRRDVVVLDGAYHGNLSALVNISPYKFDGPGGFGSPASTHVTPMPDPYRGIHRSSDAGPLYAEYVRDAVNATPVAAFVAESLLGCGGQIVLPDGYLSSAFRHVRAAGGVCIADEVQVGLGRVGTHFWGFETQGVVPDIVTVGKPIGNGHPLGAVVTTPEIAQSFATGMEYFNTFGGNPVSCAIGMAVLDVIEEENLQKHALHVGNRLLAGFKDLAERHEIIGDVRGLGLFVGVELVRNRDTLEPAAEEADYVINRMCEEGILMSTDGPLHNVLKIKPPMVFTRENADTLVHTLDRILGEDFVVHALPSHPEQA